MAVSQVKMGSIFGPLCQEPWQVGRPGSLARQVDITPSLWQEERVMILKPPGSSTGAPAQHPEDSGQTGLGEGENGPSPEYLSNSTPAMSPEVQTTARNAGLLLLQRSSHVLYAVLFAALVPRLMGPATFGQFSLLTSLAIWLVFSASLGITQIAGRYVPEFLHRDDKEGLLKFVGQMAVTRVAVGVAGGLLYYLLTVWWLRDLDWLTVGFMALSVMLFILANSIYALFLGLNQAARWGMKETLMRWLSLVFILAGVAFWGLTGACLGMALTELLILGLGCWWARPYLMKKYLGLDLGYLAPYFRLGFIFFASEVVVSVFQFAASALIMLKTGNYQEVSFFGLAYQGCTLATVAFFQLTMAFAPFLALLLAHQDSARFQEWVEQLLKWLAVSGILCFLAALFLADKLLPLLMGQAFQPVTGNLVVMTISLPFLGVASMGSVLAMIMDRPGMALEAAILRLGVFLILGVPLVGWWGSVGGSLAFVLAGMAQCGYYLLRLQGLLTFSARPWFLALGSAGLVVPLFWLKSSWFVNLALGIAAMTGYAGTLLALGLVSFGELALIWRTLSERRTPLAPTFGVD
jgi:O-antigen/teichoic acid export membrane protein